MSAASTRPSPPARARDTARPDPANDRAAPGPAAPRWAEALGVGVATALALALFLLVPTVPNFDAYYHLVWGQELLNGDQLSFETARAPTPHPLFIAVGAVLTRFGDAADGMLVALSLLCLVALVWGTYRLGALTLGAWPGLAAAVFVGISVPFVLYALRAYVDIWFLAAVIWAAVLEVRRPRHGVAAMALLAVAGLLRPEAWLLAGVLWLWCVPVAPWGRRAVLTALAAIGPAIWMLVDWAVTGDPLFSLHNTNELVSDLNRVSGIANLPDTLVPHLVDVVKLPVAIAGLIGIAVAWRRLGGRPIAVPLLLLVTGVATFVAIGFAGLSLLPRYLTVPAVALCLFAGYATLGWVADSPGRLRRWWAGATAVVVVASIAIGIPLAIPVLERMDRQLAVETGTQADLVRLLERPDIVAAIRDCGKLTFPSYRLVPNARFLLDGRRVAAARLYVDPLRRGVAVHYIDADTLIRYGFTDGSNRLTNLPVPGFTPGPRVGRLSAYLACPQRAGRAG